MKRILNRRNFIISCSAVLLALSLWAYSTKSAKERLKQRVAARLDYLEITEVIWDTFWRDLQKFKPTHAALGSLHTFSSQYRSFSRSDRENLLNSIARTFLLSTSYISAPDKPVLYTGFYEPLTTPCRNPFATLVT